MSSTATIIIAIISGVVFIYSNALYFIEMQNIQDPDDIIISMGDRKYAVRNKEGELVEVDFKEPDVEEKLMRFFSAILEKYPN